MEVSSIGIAETESRAFLCRRALRILHKTTSITTNLVPTYRQNVFLRQKEQQSTHVITRKLDRLPFPKRFLNRANAQAAYAIARELGSNAVTQSALENATKGRFQLIETTFTLSGHR